MPVEVDSSHIVRATGPVGSEIISYLLERVQRRPRDPRAFSGFARPQDLFPQPTARRLLAAPLQSCCVTGGPCEVAGPSRLRVKDWSISMASCSWRFSSVYLKVQLYTSSCMPQTRATKSARVLKHYRLNHEAAGLLRDTIVNNLNSGMIAFAMYSPRNVSSMVPRKLLINLGFVAVANSEFETVYYRWRILVFIPGSPL